MSMAKGSLTWALYQMHKGKACTTGTMSPHKIINRVLVTWIGSDNAGRWIEPTWDDGREINRMVMGMDWHVCRDPDGYTLPSVPLVPGCMVIKSTHNEIIDLLNGSVNVIFLRHDMKNPPLGAVLMTNEGNIHGYLHLSDAHVAGRYHDYYYVNPPDGINPPAESIYRNKADQCKCMTALDVGEATTFAKTVKWTWAPLRSQYKHIDAARAKQIVDAGTRNWKGNLYL